MWGGLRRNSPPHVETGLRLSGRVSGFRRGRFRGIPPLYVSEVSSIPGELPPLGKALRELFSKVLAVAGQDVRDEDAEPSGPVYSGEMPGTLARRLRLRRRRGKGIGNALRPRILRTRRREAVGRGSCQTKNGRVGAKRLHRDGRPATPRDRETDGHFAAVARGPTGPPGGTAAEKDATDRHPEAAAQRCLCNDGGTTGGALSLHRPPAPGETGLPAAGSPETTRGGASPPVPGTVAADERGNSSDLGDTDGKCRLDSLLSSQSRRFPPYSSP